MKLNNIHMIIILVCAILFSIMVGPDLNEGMQNMNSKKQINMKQMWKGVNLDKQKCANIKGAKFIGNMISTEKAHFPGCDPNTTCCQPNYIHSGGGKHPSNKKKRRRRKKRQRQNKIYSSDELNEPPGFNSYKRGVVNDYNNNSYNKSVAYDDDDDASNRQNNNYSYDSGSDSGSGSGSDSGSDSDSDSDSDYNQRNSHYPQNTVPGSFNSQLGMPRQQQTINSSEIPYGEEDKYILKSEIVPPVCPVCPTMTECPGTKKPRPCPPCARCPEPAFDCKKVPNYTKTNTMLPVPILNDFSQF